MSTMTAEPTTVTLNIADLEKAIRKIAQDVVRDIVHQELTRLVRFTAPDKLDWWIHEGPDDPEGDEELLQDAMSLLEEYKDKPEAWIGWEQLKNELAKAEAAGELPS